MPSNENGDTMTKSRPLEIDSTGVVEKWKQGKRTNYVVNSTGNPGNYTQQRRKHKPVSQQITEISIAAHWRKENNTQQEPVLRSRSKAHRVDSIVQCFKSKQITAKRLRPEQQK